MKQKSIALNTVFYTVRSLLSMVFPLITFPYVWRVLSKETIGAVGFCGSIVNYFSMLAGLGIYMIAVKEGAKVRDDKDKVNKLASEMFTLNCISTFVSYLLFLCMFCGMKKWNGYGLVMIIISITIPLSTMGVDWVFTIFEEQGYIAIRGFVVQLLSVVYLVTFVKNDSDIYHYALYSVMTGVGANVINIVKAKKYVRLNFIISENSKRFLKMSLVMFFSTVATQIYLNSDITILGYIIDEAAVAEYQATVKLYNIAKTCLVGVTAVSVSRLAYYYGRKENEKYNELFIKILNFSFFLALPAAIGMYIVAGDLLYIFAGEGCTNVTLSMKILSLALPFSILANLFASGSLFIHGKEKQIMVTAIVGATINFVLNLFLIPMLGRDAAALTTLIAELITFMMHIANVKKIQKLQGIYTNMLQTMIATAIMGGSCYFVNRISCNVIIRLCGTVLCGLIVYFTVQIVIKNENLKFLSSKLKK